MLCSLLKYTPHSPVIDENCFQIERGHDAHVYFGGDFEEDRFQENIRVYDVWKALAVI